MVAFFVAVVRFVRMVATLLGEPQIRPLLFLAALLLAGGTWFYHVVEGWRVLDALYFCVITLTTIGFGDFSPRTDLGKVFTMIYVFLGVGLFVGLIDVVARYHAASRDRRR